MLLLWRSTLEDALQSCKATGLPNHMTSPELPGLIWIHGWYKARRRDRWPDRLVGYRRQGQQMARWTGSPIVFRASRGRRHAALVRAGASGRTRSG